MLARHEEALADLISAADLRWRRQRFRQLVRREHGRRRPGRPAIASETRTLIRRMSRVNLLWGAPRLHGELAMLGIKVSRTTVAKYMVCRPGLPSPSWRPFIRNHAYDLIARGAYTECFSSVRALAVTGLHALRQWLERVVASGLRGASRRCGPQKLCASGVWHVVT
jgi:hypothetical protein